MIWLWDISRPRRQRMRSSASTKATGIERKTGAARASGETRDCLARLTQLVLAWRGLLRLARRNDHRGLETFFPVPLRTDVELAACIRLRIFRYHTVDNSLAGLTVPHASDDGFERTIAIGDGVFARPVLNFVPKERRQVLV